MTAGLLRRVHPDQVVQDQNAGGPRPSSAAFKDPELSVDAEPLLTAASLDWNFSLRKHAGYSLVSFLAGSAREKAQTVVHTPIKADQPDDPDYNPAHTDVVGRKTQAVARHLRDCAQWVYCALLQQR